MNSNKMTKSGEGGSWTNIPSQGGGGREDEVAILSCLFMPLKPSYFIFQSFGTFGSQADLTLTFLQLYND